MAGNLEYNVGCRHVEYSDQQMGAVDFMIGNKDVKIFFHNDIRAAVHFSDPQKCGNFDLKSKHDISS